MSSGGGGWVPPLGLGTTISQLGRAAKDFGSSLESSLQNVADNLQGSFHTFGQETAERAGCVTRTSSFDSLGSGVGGAGGGTPVSPGTGSQASRPASPAESASERERIVQANQSVSGLMGCGSSYSSATCEPTMLCDMCGNKFGLMSRKKLCSECSNYFCGSCLPRSQGEGGRVCSRCRVLNRSPPVRQDLMKLRVKDLQHFLTKKRVNIKSCVEKKDLVELVLRNAGVSPSSDNLSSPSSPSHSQGAGASSTHPHPRLIPDPDPSIRVSDRLPLERPANFPKNYVESSHRRDWFQEKFGPAESSGEAAQDIEEAVLGEVAEETPVETIEAEETLVEHIVTSEDDEDMVVIEAVKEPTVVDSEEKELDEVLEVTEDPVEDINNVSPLTDGAVGGQEEDESLRLPKNNNLDVDFLSDQGSSSVPASPRRFAGQGVVYLSEIKTLDDLNELSARQIKELLAMNRVNFKGCVEKEELLKIVERLWKQDQRHKESMETMDDDSLCKICMDSPIDCVMLECGHMCTCTNCGKQMAECPICRQYVVRVVKTFRA